jgi:hypothetical protein
LLAVAPARESRPDDTGPLVAAALACLNAAVDTWTASNGAIDLPTLLDQAMSDLTD